MRINVLGALSAEANDVSIVPTAGKPRQVLALLALHFGRIVPVAVLLEEVWGAAPPKSASATLQRYILQLRSRLAAALGPDAAVSAEDVLATRYGGCLLQVPAEAIDAHRFERLAAEGRQAFESGQDERAAVLLRRALGLWQGPALVDVNAGPVLEGEVLRLEQTRLVAHERCIDADLRLGRHVEMIAELVGLTARHPMHEGLHSQAMVALYRSGRQAAAVQVYLGLRQRLASEFNVEPSPQLQRMYQAMLCVDPRLDLVTGTRRTSTFDLYVA